MAKFANFNNDILENKAFLYVCFIITCISLIFFSKIGDPYSTAIFIISGYFISFFTKKMAIVLLLALAISYIYRYGVSKMVNYKEGLLSSDINDSIDLISKDQKILDFFNENKSRNNDLLNMKALLLNNLNNFTTIISNYNDILNDENYRDKFLSFYNKNKNYFTTKLNKLSNSILKEIQYKIDQIQDKDKNKGKEKSIIASVIVDVLKRLIQ